VIEVIRVAVDWPYIESQLALAELKEAPEILAELAKRRAEFDK
jgi:hypothetical protein